MRSTIAIIFASVASFFNAASAIPVINPRLESLTITFPTKGDSFEGGATTHIGWETTSAIINSPALGKITLCELAIGLEYKRTELAVLAENFSLADGSVSVIMPSDLSKGNDYFVILTDLTGNFAQGFSDEFEIFPSFS